MNKTTLTYQGQKPELYEAVETLIAPLEGFIEDMDFFKGQTILFIRFKSEAALDSFKEELQSSPLKYQVEIGSEISV